MRKTVGVVWRTMLGSCSLDDTALEARRREWAALDVHRSTADTIGAGFRIVYGNAPGVAGELERLAAAEDGCCGFATWEVAGGPEFVVLTVTGPEPGIGEIRRSFLPAG